MSYHQYLRKRSLLAKIYRNFFLYPRINHYLSGKVLDYGCGIGDFVSYRKNTYGVDIDDDNINFCRTLGLPVEKINSDVLPFDESFFDGVFMDNVLEHIAFPDSVIGEILRVLHPQGILIIGVPGVKGFKSDPDHKVFYDVDDLDKLMLQFNLRRVALEIMPINLKRLSFYMSQYCIYGVYKSNN